MKNILLALLAALSLTSCSSEKADEFSNAQKESIKQFTWATSMAFQASDATTFYSRQSRVLPKTISDEIRDCVKTPKRDGSGRQYGVVVNGTYCPIRADWSDRAGGSNRESIDLNYNSTDNEFKRFLPVDMVRLSGRREVFPAGSRQKTVLTYSGNARDGAGETVNFEASGYYYSDISESKYTIRVSFRDFMAEGIVVNDQKFYLNNAEVSRDEFTELFFILK